MKRNPIVTTFEIRDTAGNPLDIYAIPTMYNWLRAIADFSNYQMEGCDKCRQLTFEMDYLWRNANPEAPYSRFRLVRTGNCTLEHYKDAVNAFELAFLSVMPNNHIYCLRRVENAK